MGQVAVHYVEHGTGRPVLVLHGAGVDHREAEACFEPAFARRRGAAADLPRPPGNGPDRRSRDAAQRRRRPRHAARLRRRGHRRAPVPARSVTRRARTTRRRWPRGARRRSPVWRSSVRCCPECATSRSTASSSGSGEIGDDVFRSYFVIQTPEMLERYERYVAPAAALVDQAAHGADRRTVGAHPRSRAGVRGSDAGRGGAAGLDGRVRGRRRPRSTTTRTPRSPWSTTRDTPCPTSSRSSCAP